MKRIAQALMIVSMIAAGSSAVWAAPSEPLKLVPAVDLQRYLGRWYEIARYQHSFEKNLVGATAEYSLRPDGKVTVLNSGFQKTLDGAYKEARAVAWVPNPAVSSALKVMFFWPFAGDYLVFGLDEQNYSWALVGSNSRKYLWFLARTPEVSPEVLAKMKEITTSQGYDLSKLYMVPQKAR